MILFTIIGLLVVAAVAAYGLYKLVKKTEE